MLMPSRKRTALLLSLRHVVDVKLPCDLGIVRVEEVSAVGEETTRSRAYLEVRRNREALSHERPTTFAVGATAKSRPSGRWRGCVHRGYCRRSRAADQLPPRRSMPSDVRHDGRTIDSTPQPNPAGHASLPAYGQQPLSGVGGGGGRREEGATCPGRALAP